jgi:hypothetical protein
MEYDSKSKGYRIYWPEKRSITVERNIVFNQADINLSDDLAIIYGKAQSEGEKEKTIQSPQNNAEDVDKPENEDSESQELQKKTTEPHQSPKTTNTIQFPSTDKFQPEPQPEVEPCNNEQSSAQQYGHGHRNQPLQGTYKTLNDGLVAAITAFVKEPPEEDDETSEEATVNVDVEPIEEDNKDDDSTYELPPDIALVRFSNGDPKTLDKALCGPNTKKWQEALQYEINQLEKFNTWVVTDLPPG